MPQLFLVIFRLIEVNGNGLLEQVCIALALETSHHGFQEQTKSAELVCPHRNLTQCLGQSIRPALIHAEKWV